MMRPDQLIDNLVADLRPVRRAPSPARALAIWLAVTVPSLALVIWLMGLRPTLPLRPAFLLDQALALSTAVIAAYGAVCAGRPDQPTWKLALPVVMMMLWLAVMVGQCALMTIGGKPGVLALHIDFACVPAMALAGFIPSITMVLLLRLSPIFRTNHACLCGALAATAAAEFALRLFHAEGSFLTLLVWQMGSVILLTISGSLIGKWVLAHLPGGMRIWPIPT